jgi:hypothetical protein
MNLNKISFVKIRPNSDKNIDSVLTKFILDMHNSIDPSLYKEDILDLFDDHINICKESDPVSYINNFFSQINNTDIRTQNYDILSYDRVGSSYNIMIINNLYNIDSNSVEFDRDKQFNLLASTLVKSYYNSKVIFGDVFIMRIDSDSYDQLLLLSELNETNKTTPINKTTLINKTNIKYDILYKSFTLDDLIMSYYNVLYVKIYSKNSNNIFVYDRTLIDNLLKQDYLKYEINKNIIGLNINGDIIYCKLTKSLPNSHNHIIEMIKNQNNNKSDNLDQITNLTDNYLDNMTTDDIIKYIR